MAEAVTPARAAKLDSFASAGDFNTPGDVRKVPVLFKGD